MPTRYNECWSPPRATDLPEMDDPETPVRRRRRTTLFIGDRRSGSEVSSSRLSREIDDRPSRSIGEVKLPSLGEEMEEEALWVQHLEEGVAAWEETKESAHKSVWDQAKMEKTPRHSAPALGMMRQRSQRAIENNCESDTVSSSEEEEGSSSSSSAPESSSILQVDDGVQLSTARGRGVSDGSGVRDTCSTSPLEDIQEFAQPETPFKSKSAEECRPRQEVSGNSKSASANAIDNQWSPSEPSEYSFPTHSPPKPPTPPTPPTPPSFNGSSVEICDRKSTSKLVNDDDKRKRIQSAILSWMSSENLNDSEAINMDATPINDRSQRLLRRSHSQTEVVAPSLRQEPKKSPQTPQQNGEKQAAAESDDSSSVRLRPRPKAMKRTGQSTSSFLSYRRKIVRSQSWSPQDAEIIADSIKNGDADLEEKLDATPNRMTKTRRAIAKFSRRQFKKLVMQEDVVELDPPLGEVDERLNALLEWFHRRNCPPELTMGAARILCHYAFPEEKLSTLRERLLPRGGMARILKLVGEGLRVHRSIPQEDISLGEMIAQGAAGKVYCGSWNGQSVAIKVMTPLALYFNPKEFWREVSIMSIIQHEMLLPCLGATVAGEDLWMIMPRYDGSILDLIGPGSKQGLRLSEKMQVLSDVACGLATLHKSDLLHRDLKAGNVLYRAQETGTGEQNLQIALADFGTSRAQGRESVDRRMTKAIGTPAYMAPEQFEGESYTNKVDVWAFGVLSWQLCVEMEPYAYESHMAAVARKIVAGETLPIPPGMPTSLQTMLRDCWQLDPCKRPSMSEVEHELRELHSFFLDVEKHDL